MYEKKVNGVTVWKWSLSLFAVETNWYFPITSTSSKHGEIDNCYWPHTKYKGVCHSVHWEGGYTLSWSCLGAGDGLIPRLDLAWSRDGVFSCPPPALGWGRGLPWPGDRTLSAPGLGERATLTRYSYSFLPARSGPGEGVYWPDDPTSPSSYWWLHIIRYISAV